MIGYIKRVSAGQFNVRALKLLYFSYVRSKLDFAAVIWEPYQQTYIDDIEAVQKVFLYHLIDVCSERNERHPSRLSSYEIKCSFFKISTLLKRRKEFKLLFGFDVMKKTIADNNISDKFIPNTTPRIMRVNRLLVEPLHRADYAYWQPVSSIIRLLNEKAHIYNCSASRDQLERL